MRGGGVTSNLPALPEPAIVSLSPYFPRLDLREVTVKEGIPLWIRIGARIRVAAVAINNTVYFAPGQYDPDSPTGLSKVGHELVHVQQQRDAGGLILFGIPYVAEWIRNWLSSFDSESAYRAISAEVEARAMEERILRALVDRVRLSGDPYPDDEARP
jgi:hypothetical protein